MSDIVFVDTNVFIRLIDRKDLTKTNAAIAFFKEIRGTQVHISTQVLKEFCNTAIKKIGLSEGELKNQLAIFTKFSVSDTPLEIIEDAIEIKFRCDLSFRDSIIIASALAANCDILYSED